MAPVAELVYAYALGAYGETLRGSSPLGSTKDLFEAKYMFLYTEK